MGMSKQPFSPSLKLPTIVVAADYHEFAHMENLLRRLTKSKRVKVEEIGLEDGVYVGIVYTRKDKAYKNILKEFEIV